MPGEASKLVADDFYCPVGRILRPAEGPQCQVTGKTGGFNRWILRLSFFRTAALGKLSQFFFWNHKVRVTAIETSQ